MVFPVSAIATVRERIDRALCHLPADVAAVLIVPSLAETSQSITKAMEGMDRREMLLGARPIDHLKSITGVVQHVDDDGPLMVGWMLEPAGSVARGSFVVLVPTADPLALIESSFTSTNDAGVVEHSSGAPLHVRAFDDAVLLGSSPLDGVTMSEQDVAEMRRRLGDRGNALLDDADAALLMLGSQAWFAGIDAVASRLRRTFRASDSGETEMVARLERLTSAFDTSITTVEFDPLAVIVRSFTHFAADGPLVSSSPAVNGPPAGSAKGGGLSALPRDSYLVCASVALSAVGFESLADVAKELAGMEAVPSWLRAVGRAEFAAYATDAGPGAGALNNAAMVLSTDEPVRVLRGLQEAVSQSASSDGHASPSWAAIGSIEGVEDVASYHVKRPTFVPGEISASLIHSILFGPAGWQGFAWSGDDHVTLTFSKRRGTVRLVHETSQATSLASDAAIRTMRSMIGHDRDAEVYLNAGHLARLLTDRLRQLPPLQQAVGPFPDLGIHLPPVGFAADLEGTGLHTTTIVPADVVAVLLEAALQYGSDSMRPHSPSPAE
jgi:hypothetical protein